MTDPPVPATAPAHPAPQRGEVARVLLWFGLLGGPVAWILQHIANYAFASYPCLPRGEPRGSVLPGWSWDYPVLWLIALAALALAAAAGFAAFRAWRKTRGESAGASHLLEVGEGRTHFMAGAGLFISAASVAVILFEIVPLLGVPLCWR